MVPGLDWSLDWRWEQSWDFQWVLKKEPHWDSPMAQSLANLLESCWDWNWGCHWETD